MTTKTFAATAAADTLEVFPDFPPRDDMQNSIHIGETSIQESLSLHFGNSDTTLILGEVPVNLDVPLSRAGVRVPDLMVAFDVDKAGIIARRGYAIDLVGKPPDFVLEIASPNTARNDYTDKRLDYERFGVTEYWRFDPTGGEWHDAALAGDRLVDGRYRPIAIEWSSEDMGRGYSPVLRLYLCWEDGRLRLYDPEAGRYLPTLRDETGLRVRAEQRERQQAQRADLAEAESRRLRQQLRELGRE